MLSVLSHVIPSTALVIIRKHVSALSLMSVRSVLFKLLEFITNLDSLPSRYLVTDAPSLVLLQTAVLDLVYGSSRRRPGNFQRMTNFPFC